MKKGRSLESRLKMRQIAKERNYVARLQNSEIQEKTAMRNRERMKGNSLAKGYRHSEVFKEMMSKRMKGKKSPLAGQYGERNPNWKGGRLIKNGYVWVKQRNHPNADSHGYIAEHRLVMEKHLGRYLESHEIVHHKDGNKQNNKDYNLFLTDRNKHEVGYTEGYKRGFATALFLFLIASKGEKK